MGWDVSNLVPYPDMAVKFEQGRRMFWLGGQDGLILDISGS